MIKYVGKFGMPFFKSPDKYGNLYIKFKVIYPEKLSEEQNEKIKEIFKDEKINKIENLTNDVDEFILEDYNENDSNTSYKGGKIEDYENEDKKDISCKTQ